MTTAIADRFAEAQPWNPDDRSPSALWVEGDNGWELISQFDDPYEAMTPLALLSDETALLEMFGKMTKLDDDGEPTGEKFHVRLLFAVRGDNYEVLVQKADGESFSDPSAEGMFLDLFMATKALLGK